MTDQHQGFNPPHQHGPAPYTAPSSKRPVIIAAAAAVVALVMVFGGIIAYNTFFNRGIPMCAAMPDGSDTAVDPDPDAKLPDSRPSGGESSLHPQIAACGTG